MTLRIIPSNVQNAKYWSQEPTHKAAVYSAITMVVLLSRYHSVQAKQVDGSDPQSHNNYQYLSTPEKDKHLQWLHQQHCMDQKSLPVYKPL